MYVQQQSEFGCVVACVAMATGLPYGKIVELLGHSPDDTVTVQGETLAMAVTVDEVVRFMWERGTYAISLCTREFYNKRSSDDPARGARRHIYTSDEIKRVLAAAPRAFVVFATGHDTDHMAFWHRGVLYDPAEPRTVTDVSSLTIYSAVLLAGLYDGR